MLPAPARLRRSEDIARVRQEGRRWNHPLLALYVHPQAAPGTGSRFAFSVGGRVGRATRRNRVKRRLREIVRRRLERVRPGYDCLFVARAAAGTVDFEELDEAVVRLLARSGMITGEES